MTDGRMRISSGSTFEDEISAGLADPRMQIEIEVTALRQQRPATA